MTSNTSQRFFEEMYRRDDDPWSFASSPYELSRYDAILTAVEHRRYRAAFEPGCSIGILTRRLAAISQQVEAMDISPTAVARANAHCVGLPNVKVMCGTLPNDIPSSQFDLILFSEIGYYFNEVQLFDLSNKLIQRLNDNGIILAAHWLGYSEDHILSGDRVHEILATIPFLALEHSERHPEFRLDRWSKVRGTKA